MATNKHRFYYAFDWKKVVEIIKEQTTGFVLIASSGEEDKRLTTALKEVSDRVINIRKIYDDKIVDEIIHAADVPPFAVPISV